MQYLYVSQPAYATYYYDDGNWCGNSFDFCNRIGYGSGFNVGFGTGTGNNVLCVTPQEYGEIGRAVL
ncbi:MAG: hypothetical protein ACMUHX_05595 [bacterium]